MIATPPVQRKVQNKNDEYINEVIKDFWTCCISREASLLGRKEVLTGKAKFGILGDGKEVPQVALARAFKKGDFRSGYYRDQTLMFALGLSTVEDFFAQLYADTNNDPFSGGRQMNAHFATPLIDENGEWIDHTKQFNISSDISSTGGQMARGLGLAFASKLYRNSKTLSKKNKFSNGGQEVCFCTIGDASTSEGIFWETVNASVVLKVPLAISVWDDGYGISVPIELQTAKKSISKALSGLELDEQGDGLLMKTCKAWDYAGLVNMYTEGVKQLRKEGIPGLFHIQEVTQPQGHSTSGSHERYKSEERLKWETEMDCITQMGHWMVASDIATKEEIERMKADAKEYVLEAKKRAWEAFQGPNESHGSDLLQILEKMKASGGEYIDAQIKALKALMNPAIADFLRLARRTAYYYYGTDVSGKEELHEWIRKVEDLGHDRYHTELYNDGDQSALRVPVVPMTFDEESQVMSGYQILNKFFDQLFEKRSDVIAFGEDVGHIGDVNQGFAGLQEKYGVNRVFDTGIREWSIVGQAIGAAMRGLRPIAEIQYLDYIIYGLQPLCDDLATLRYRSNGMQKAPAIIRTRGHRLEGIWHAGSPLAMLLSSLRGMHVLVPRNMSVAAGFYNTLMQSDEPAVVIECLNGYRLKERLPNNIGEYTIPLGVPEVLKEGEDITLVTYGSCIREAEEGIELLENMGISVELIDVQSLLPFDLEHSIVESIRKTNRVVFMDEDVPGGATAYMMQEVLENQRAYQYLDSQPVTITASAHRPPYGSDGDYFSKPNAENVFETLYQIMHEANPEEYPLDF